MVRRLHNIDLLELSLEVMSYVRTADHGDNLFILYSLDEYEGTPGERRHEYLRDERNILSGLSNSTSYTKRTQPRIESWIQCAR